MAKKVLVCQNSTCQQQGSEQVLAALKGCAQQNCQVPNPPFIPIESGCLGQCGNGPMVLVVPYPPEAGAPKIWYHRVRAADVGIIAKQHLLGDRPVTRLLYPAVHGTQKSIWPWAIGLAILLAGCVAIAWSIGSQYVPSH